MMKSLFTLTLLGQALTAYATDFTCVSLKSLGTIAMNTPSINFILSAAEGSIALKNVVISQKGQAPRSLGDLAAVVSEGGLTGSLLAAGVEFESEEDAVNLTIREKDYEQLVLAGKTFKAVAVFAAPYLGTSSVERSVSCRP